MLQMVELYPFSHIFHDIVDLTNPHPLPIDIEDGRHRRGPDEHTDLTSGIGSMKNLCRPDILIQGRCSWTDRSEDRSMTDLVRTTI